MSTDTKTNPFCPECGFGTEGDGIFRLPHHFPFNGACQTCKTRSEESLRALGRKHALQQGQAVLKSLVERNVQ